MGFMPRMTAFSAKKRHYVGDYSASCLIPVFHLLSIKAQVEVALALRVAIAAYSCTSL
jgi:hypothetical protein